ncbi:MAG: polysaccharide biosynthesis protein [Pseudomonadales bacterium]|nr:polysaccharide biosynthesis protein [Pseudomonadales bacterium]
MFENKSILITGATGTLGSALTRSLLSGAHGSPKKLLIFSRDEAKQFHLMQSLEKRFGGSINARVASRIGDIRNYDSVVKALKSIDTVIHCAALKQVPNSERFPEEAIATNIMGINNIINAIQNLSYPVDTVIGISTDKAVEPVSVMGMSKALQEKLIIAANQDIPRTRFINVRYGNVLGSRGSFLPTFLSQVKAGLPITVTNAQMTRFLITLDQAIETIFYAYRHAPPGYTVIPRIKAARIMDIANLLASNSGIEILETGTRHGEKIHETLATASELCRAEAIDTNYLLIAPELATNTTEKPCFKKADIESYTSAEHLENRDTLRIKLIEFEKKFITELEH